MISLKLIQDKLDDLVLKAFYDGDLETIKDLYNKYPPKKGKKNSIFYNFLNLTTLFQPGVDLHKRANRGLQLVCQNGNVDILDFLLKIPTFVKNINNTNQIAEAYVTAIEHGHIDIARSLLPVIKNKDSIHLKSALITVSARGDLNAVKYILTDHLINSDERTKINLFMYSSPFMAACENGQLDVVRYMTTSSELHNRIDIFSLDRTLVTKDEKIMKFFIYDLGLEKHNMKKIQFTDKELLEKIFFQKDMYKKLDSELKTNVNSSDKRKNKI